MKQKEEKLTPLEAIQSCIGSHFTLCGGSFSNHLGGPVERRWKTLRPGALVERMPERIRQGLRQLKSHHFNDMPMDRWRFMDDTYTRKKAWSEKLMKFDREMLGIQSTHYELCYKCKEYGVRRSNGKDICFGCGDEKRPFI